MLQRVVSPAVLVYKYLFPLTAATGQTTGIYWLGSLIVMELGEVN